MVDLPTDIEALDFDGLKALVLELMEKYSALEAENAALRKENRRLKGLNDPPNVKPSGMDKQAQSRRKAKSGRAANKARRGSKKARERIDERRVITADAPAGSRFKGYEDYLVQDLRCHPHTVLLRRERWRAPDGRCVTASLPAGVRGHFGGELRRFVLALYHGAQTTVERLATLLRDLGVDISKRQVVRLLNDEQGGFGAEAQAVLRAGLETAPWISVDDTGARHDDRNAVTTQIGNDAFTWFGTSFSKSRLNFLDLLRAGHGDYVINDAALGYMRKRALSGPVIARLEAAPARRFADHAAWMAHLQRLGVAALKVTPDPVRIATEGALWGAIVEHGLLGAVDGDTVIVSDGAGQFNVARHALCWVHAERLIHKLDAFTDAQRRQKERIRFRVWWLYADLKAYRGKPTRKRRRELRRRFDTLFTTQTGFVTLDRLLARLHANRDELLVVLDRPEIPLHTNGSENDIRACVTRRKISGGTRSMAGKQARDTYLALLKTCRKLGLSFWNYLGDRLDLPDASNVPPLPDLVRQRCLAME